MTTQSTAHVMMLGPREAEIMRLLWLHGPSTVRELLGRIVADPPIAYTTVMSVCVGLLEKSLIIRRRATHRDKINVAGVPFLYEAAIGEANFTCVAQSIEGRLVMSLPAPAEVQPAPPAVAVEQHALIQRAEAAERRAEALAAKLGRAERQIEALEHRARLAEERAGVAERRVEQLERQLGRPPRRKRPIATWYTTALQDRDRRMRTAEKDNTPDDKPGAVPVSPNELRIGRRERVVSHLKMARNSCTKRSAGCATRSAIWPSLS